MLTRAEKREAVDLLFDLVSIPSSSGKEEKIASFIKGWTIEHGYNSATQDGVGNILALSGEGESQLLYCGHMDTTPGELPVRRVGNRITGRGSSDAKGPLAAMLFAGSRLAKMRENVSVLAVVGEETGSTGIRHALKNGIGHKFAVFGEPSGCENIVVGYRGRLEARVDFFAQSFHASKPWVGRSALQCAVDFAKMLEGFGTPSTGEKFNSVSALVTRLNSGVAGNVAPPSASVTVDVRFPPGVSPDDLLAEVRRLARESAGGARADVFVVEASKGVLSDTSSPLVKALRRSVFNVTKRPAKVVKKTGSGDMNHAVAVGVDSVTYGPGSTLAEHSEEESIDVNDYLLSIEVLTLLPSALTGILKVQGGKRNIRHR